MNNLSATTTKAWPSITGSLVSLERPKGLTTTKKNESNKNTKEFESNNFANFANVFQNTASTTINTDPFLDSSNNNITNYDHNSQNDFFADFNDSFVGTTTPNSNKTPAFDAFGGSAFGNGKGSAGNSFDDDDNDPFGSHQLVVSENNNKFVESTSNGSKRVSGVRTVEGRESYSSKKAPLVKDNTKPNSKYSEDYSKNFDNDLEEALKRSLFDQ